jgi:hypothetical protein
MKGIVLTQPELIDNGKRTTFEFLREDTSETIFCISSLQFDVSIPIKIRDKIIFTDGNWPPDSKGNQQVLFIFDGFIKNSN